MDNLVQKCWTCEHWSDRKNDICPFHHLTLENNYCGYNDLCLKV